MNGTDVIKIILFIILIIIAIFLVRYPTVATIGIIGAAMAVSDVESRNDGLLATEYQRWSRAQKQYDMVTRDMNQQAAYEARAILERWHISAYNLMETLRRDPTGAQRVKAEMELRTHPITQKMRSEFLEKKLFSESSVDSIIDRMFAIEADKVPRMRNQR